jgi:nicotinate-nucleotide adenylyltransferase
MLDISSTDIRQRAAHGLPIGHLVPPSVARYIEQHRLYQEGNAH